MTFLWRAIGSPEVSGENPFTDVSEDDYYYTAVLWALQNGITTGTSDTEFSPDATCTRAEIVTFLYRASGETFEAAETFTDVSADAWYAEAVAWAAAEGITTGTSDTTFTPDASCTRGQIVTFLYRDMA
ncbi:MAG: S-layer homology domain-containing protein [Oscillospiraceae bacterium]|nr:S-layer homology domain-containing protein [Oscillospiraceae bacterium]